MATVVPPPPKRQRREHLELTQTQQDVTTSLSEEDGSFFANFVDLDGNKIVGPVEIPLADATERTVSLLINTMLGHARDDFVPFRFPVPGPQPSAHEYISDFRAFFRRYTAENPSETTIQLPAVQQAVFKVNIVTRQAHKISGHGKPILCVQFSPATSARLATGSGDNTARVWDTETGTPKHTLKGHSGWVLGVNWSPDGELLATCSMDKTVRIWNPNTGQQMGQEFRGHADRVFQTAWEPYHLWRDGTPRLASASRDATVRIWIVNTGRTEHVLSGHTGHVTCVKWGGTGLIYTASRDKRVRVWNAEAGTLVHDLKSHAHWVNHLALSTEFVLRTGYFDHTRNVPDTDEARRAKARARFEAVAMEGGRLAERLVSASEDQTLFIWDPMNQGAKPVARMTGHQKAVNHIVFSPDGSLLASAAWDNHVKIWGARDGKFIETLRGHVAPVYQCAFSADSRMLVSASKDSTLKVWNMRTFKLASDLPGHDGQVYTVDWGGQVAASGGEDKAVRIWRN